MVSFICGLLKFFVFSKAHRPIFRVGRSDTGVTGVGTSNTLTLSKVDLGVGVECRKSGVKGVASRSVGSPVLSSDTSTLFEK